MDFNGDGSVGCRRVLSDIVELLLQRGQDGRNNLRERSANSGGDGLGKSAHLSDNELILLLHELFHGMVIGRREEGDLTGGGGRDSGLRDIGVVAVVVGRTWSG